STLFGNDKPAPALGNLSTHLSDKHKGLSLPSDAKPGETIGISEASAKIIQDFLVDGKLNPVINLTQANFLKIFAAWIIEDDLAFTTGETDGINRLFQFLQTRYQLPTDTTYIHLMMLVYLIAVTLDNAAPNNVLIRTLSRLLQEKFDLQFVPDNSQIRCLAHVVNLVVQKILATLDEVSDPDVQDDY
ncbi:hypothetical protein B0H10DRAFT_1628930, partial [Mycena sp. CBHHK59/15]